MQSRHKRVQICWVPSHIGIEGNEKVDTLAKVAADSDGECTYVTYPSRDYYPIVKKAVLNRWQEQWHATTNKQQATKDEG